MQHKNLVIELHVVEPQGSSLSTDISAAMAAGKLQAEVGWRVVGITPLYLAHGHHFTLAVEGILLVVATLEEIHVGFVVALAGNVAIVNLKLGAVDPVGCLFGEILNGGAYTLGVDIALGILPTLL